MNSFYTLIWLSKYIMIHIIYVVSQLMITMQWYLFFTFLWLLIFFNLRDLLESSWCWLFFTLRKWCASELGICCGFFVTKTTYIRQRKTTFETKKTASAQLVCAAVNIRAGHFYNFFNYKKWFFEFLSC